MKRIFILLVLIVIGFFSISCGKKGALLPPVKKIPKAAEDFEVAQRGNTILLKWKNPDSYSDGSLIPEIEDIEIRVLLEEIESDEKSRKIPEDVFLRKGEIVTLIHEAKRKEGLPKEQEDDSKREYVYHLSDVSLLKKRHTFGIRIKDKKGRWSSVSKLHSLEPKILPLPPEEVKAKLLKNRIEVQWKAPEKNFDQSPVSQINGYNVYRKQEKGEFRRLNPKPLQQNKYVDRNLVYGKTYLYMIRAVSDDSAVVCESHDSKVIEILAEDTFAPAPPKGLAAISGENMIALVWDVHKEKDILGYRIWRKIAGQRFFKLLTPEPVIENSYNDSTVEMNIRYDYAITAVDYAGNESLKSKIASETLKGDSL